jgi:ATP-dependent DNA helicase RecG
MEQAVCRPNDPAIKNAGIRSVYRSTEGLRQRQIRAAVRQALETYGTQLAETLPAEMRQRHHLPGIRQAMEDIHFPKDL